MSEQSAEKAHMVEVSDAGVHVCRVCGYWGMRPPPIPCTRSANDRPVADLLRAADRIERGLGLDVATSKAVAATLRAAVDRSADECQHDWLDRPESDTRECLICGDEW